MKATPSLAKILAKLLMPATLVCAFFLGNKTALGSPTFTVIHSFTISGATSVPLEADPLCLGADGNLYGTTAAGILKYEYGAFYKVTPAGAFSLVSALPIGAGDNVAALTLGNDGNFYGSARSIFQITPAGVTKILYTFTNGIDGLTISPLAKGPDGWMYGVSPDGGNAGLGTIFKISTGGDFEIVYSFTNGTDGASPLSGLFPGPGGFLYGTSVGGAGGTVFKVDTNGNFTAIASGIEIEGSMAVDASTNIYGAVTTGSASQWGNIEKVAMDGTLSSLYTFTNGVDGSQPLGVILGSDGNIYGTTVGGGTNYGSVFKLTTNGTFTVLYNFTNSTENTANQGTLAQDRNGNLYGSAFNGGPAPGHGMVYKIGGGSAAPQVGSLKVTISPAGAVAAGAKWQVNGGAWEASGATETDLPVGTYTVSFLPLAKWVAPGAQTVTVLNGATVIDTAEYGAEGGPTFAPITVSQTGSGTITKDYNGDDLQIGKTFTMTAKAAAGFVFSNWSGTISTNGPTIKFVMASNIDLTANFVPNPFIPLAGIYNGLFTGGAVVDVASSGLLSDLVLKTTGQYTAKIWLAGASYPISGAFDLNGYSACEIKRSSAAGGNVYVTMNIGATRTILGTVENAFWGSTLNAEAVGEFAGGAAYTIVMAPLEGFGLTPPGFSYLLVTNHSGQVTIAGGLANGDPVSQSVPLSILDRAPVYVSLDQKSGILTGWLYLTNGTGPLGASLTWIKGATASGLYRSGFTNTMNIVDSGWTNPPAKQAAFVFTSGTLQLSDGNLGEPLNYTVSLGDNNAFTVSSRSSTGFKSGVVTPKTGAFTIKFLDGKTLVTGYGAFLQDSATGGGYWISGTNAGMITIEP